MKKVRYHFEIFTYIYVTISASYVKRRSLQNGQTQTNKYTHKQTNKQTNKKHTYRVKTEELLSFYFCFFDTVASKKAVSKKDLSAQICNKRTVTLNVYVQTPMDKHSFLHQGPRIMETNFELEVNLLKIQRKPFAMISFSHFLEYLPIQNF